VRVLTTGDDNTGQQMSVPVPGRASPLVVSTADASSLGGAPWGSASFVDPLTALPLASQTGAPASPYESAQLAADNTTDGNVIVLGPGDAGPVSLVQQSFTFYGLGLLDQTFAATNRPRIAGLTFADPSLSNLVQRFVNVELTDAVLLNAEGYLSAQGCEFQLAIAGVLQSEFNDCVCRDTVTAEGLTSIGSAFDGEVTTTFATFQTSTTNGNVNASTACSFRNHTFGGAITVTSPAISLDYYSFAQATAAGVTFTTPPTIVDPPAGGSYVYYFRYNGTADGQFFAGPSGQGTPVPNEGQGSIVAVRAGTLQNLRVRCFNGVVSNAAVAFTVRVNGADTGITCTLNPGDTDGSDLVNTAALAAGDNLSFGVAGGTNANTPAFTAIAFELE